MFPRIPWHAVSWKNSSFLIATLLLTLTVVPWYLWTHGLSLFQGLLFVGFFIATGLSITLGYHRLFSHMSFKASWPVRFGTLFFGAGAFENSAYVWSADHRRHHKYVDHEDDPYNINRGFFHAHMGWVMFKLAPEPPIDNVPDLEKDSLVMWQHRNYVSIAIFASFILPALIGYAWGGVSEALGAFLLAGVARVVCVQHMTFFINSLCHTLGSRPYSSRCTARDSAIMAFFTFGEGYHNFHHEFQHDYRNGVKPWQFDPTKWSIWCLNKLGLVRGLRRVPAERILLAEVAEKQRQLDETLQNRSITLAEQVRVRLHTAHEQLQHATQVWEAKKAEYGRAMEQKLAASRQRVAALKQEFDQASDRLRAAIDHWHQAHQLARASMA
ncbi:MAG TPA: acyl-CoA desaturase [Verrucomicrobiales bacterium]|nr:acyl-CoA desaturase [Verrucomicrobiales bacterium]